MCGYHWRGKGGGRGRGRGWRGGGEGGWWSQQPQQPMSPLTPPPSNVLRVIVPTNDNNGLNSTIAGMFARAPFMTVVDIGNGKVLNASSLNNLFANMPGGAGISIAQWIIASGAKIVLAPSLGPNVSSMLSQAGIRVYQVTPGLRVIDALKYLRLVV